MGKYICSYCNRRFLNRANLHDHHFCLKDLNVYLNRDEKYLFNKEIRKAEKEKINKALQKKRKDFKLIQVCIDTYSDKVIKN